MADLQSEEMQMEYTALAETIDELRQDLAARDAALAAATETIVRLRQQLADIVEGARKVIEANRVTGIEAPRKVEDLPSLDKLPKHTTLEEDADNQRLS